MAVNSKSKPCRKGLHVWDRSESIQCLECRKSRRTSETGKSKATEEARLWRAANMQHVRSYRNSYKAKRRAVKLQRTPSWSINKFKHFFEGYYRLAKLVESVLGEPVHVDHIVPLQGKIVSGLHLPWNVQLLTAEENLKKSNKA